MDWAKAVFESLADPGPLVLMVEITAALLILATILGAVFSRLTPHLVSREFNQRIRSWWIMVALFVLAVTIDWRLTLVFLALLSYLALKEFYTLVHLRLADRRAILLAYFAILAQYTLVYIEWYGLFVVFIPVYMFVILPFRLVLAGDTERFTTSMGKLHWGLMAFVFGLSHLAFFLVLDLDPAYRSLSGGRGLLFYVVFLAEFNDVLQYLFGKTLGRHKMVPKISPGKTWEGFLGGLISTSILAVLLRFLTPMDWLFAAVAGLLIACLGPAGDVVISAIKRDVGVKDSGTAIPGHGGILDRVDSLCFSVPVFFHYVRYFYGA